MWIVYHASKVKHLLPKVNKREKLVLNYIALSSGSLLQQLLIKLITTCESMPTDSDAMLFFAYFRLWFTTFFMTPPQYLTSPYSVYVAEQAANSLEYINCLPLEYFLIFTDSLSGRALSVLLKWNTPRIDCFVKLLIQCRLILIPFSKPHSGQWESVLIFKVGL